MITGVINLSMDSGVQLRIKAAQVTNRKKRLFIKNPHLNLYSKTYLSLFRWKVTREIKEHVWYFLLLCKWRCVHRRIHCFHYRVCSRQVNIGILCTGKDFTQEVSSERHNRSSKRCSIKMEAPSGCVLLMYLQLVQLYLRRIINLKSLPSGGVTDSINNKKTINKQWVLSVFALGWQQDKEKRSLKNNIFDLWEKALTASLNTFVTCFPHKFCHWDCFETFITHDSQSLGKEFSVFEREEPPPHPLLSPLHPSLSQVSARHQQLSQFNLWNWKSGFVIGCSCNWPLIYLKKQH